ncbi:hypothetical protein EPUL_004687, partial [Erysiphe pulchra]
HGKNVTSFIAKARNNLDLDYKYGCVPRNLSQLRSTFPKNDSFVTWFVNELLPDIARKKSHQASVATFVMVSSGFMRSDLLKGPFTRDTSYIFTPFNDNFKMIKNVPFKAALDIYNRGFWDRRNVVAQPFNQVSTSEQTLLRSRSFGSKSINRDKKLLDNQKFFTASRPPTPVEGYVTIDDDGSDGDDTLHLPLAKIVQPPPIISAVVGLPAEGEPEFADLVYNLYVTPMMLSLLNNMGHNFNTTNVEDYSNEPIRDVISQWVKDNWTGEC